VLDKECSKRGCYCKNFNSNHKPTFRQN